MVVGVDGTFEPLETRSARINALNLALQTGLCTL